MTDLPLDRNLGLDLVRTTEAAAVAAGRWMGLGRRDEADDDAAAAMARALDLLAIDGTVVIGAGGETLADLTGSGTTYVVARGGRGGLGNAHYLSNRNRAPEKCTEGKEGEAWLLQLELNLQQVGVR